MMMQITEDTPPDMLAGTMDLLVHLPEKLSSIKMTVNRSTPMMDLLVQVTNAHRLKTSAHIIQAIGYAPGHNVADVILPYKPNTPIGALDVQEVKVVPKSLFKTSSFRAASLTNLTVSNSHVAQQQQQPFENTFRLQVHLPRNQLYVIRVNQDVQLRTIMRNVCNDKGLDQIKYEFRHPGNIHEVLDPQLTLADYQLTEVNLVAKDRAISVTDMATLQREEDRRRHRNSGGVFSLFFKRSNKNKNTYSTSSISSNDGANSNNIRSISPSISDLTNRSTTPPALSKVDGIGSENGSDTTAPVLKPKVPARKRRPAPPRPTSQISITSNTQPTQKEENEEKAQELQINSAPVITHLTYTSNLDTNQTKFENVETKEMKINLESNGITVCHSRNSSDSSGYHEASILSDAGNTSHTLPRRLNRNLASSSTSINQALINAEENCKNSTNLTAMESHSNSMSNLTLNRKKRPPPPPPETNASHPMKSFISVTNLSMASDRGSMDASVSSTSLAGSPKYTSVEQISPSTPTPTTRDAPKPQPRQVKAPAPIPPTHVNNLSECPVPQPKPRNTFIRKPSQISQKSNGVTILEEEKEQDLVNDKQEVVKQQKSESDCEIDKVMSSNWQNDETALFDGCGDAQDTISQNSSHTCVNIYIKPTYTEQIEQSTRFESFDDIKRLKEKNEQIDQTDENITITKEDASPSEEKTNKTEQLNEKIDERIIESINEPIHERTNENISKTYLEIENEVEINDSSEVTNEPDWQYQLPSPPKAFKDAIDGEEYFSSLNVIPALTNQPTNIIDPIDADELYKKLNHIKQSDTVTETETTVSERSDYLEKNYADKSETDEMLTNETLESLEQRKLSFLEKELASLQSKLIEKQATKKPKRSTSNCNTLPNFKLTTYKESPINIYEDDKSECANLNEKNSSKTFTNNRNTLERELILKKTEPEKYAIKECDVNTFDRNLIDKNNKINEMYNHNAQLFKDDKEKPKIIDIKMKPSDKPDEVEFKRPLTKFEFFDGKIQRTESFSNHVNGGVNSHLKRSKSHVSVEKAKLTAANSDSLNDLRKTVSQWSINDLQSLQVMRSILPKITPPSSPEQEKPSIEVQLSKSSDQSHETNRNETVSNTPNPRYRYTTPAVKLSTWSERPKSDIYLKSDNDYVTNQKMINCDDSDTTDGPKREVLTPTKDDVSIEELTQPVTVNPIVNENKPEPIKIANRFVNQVPIGFRKVTSPRPRSIAIESLNDLQTNDLSRVPIVRAVELKKTALPLDEVRGPWASSNKYFHKSSENITQTIVRKNSFNSPLFKNRFSCFDIDTNRNVENYNDIITSVSLNQPRNKSPKKGVFLQAEQQSGDVQTNQFIERPLKKVTSERHTKVEDPRDELLSAIKNFGGKQNLRSVKTYY